MSPALDYDMLLNHLGNDRELAVEILKVFLNDGPDRLGSFKEASFSHDQKLMIKFSHSLKGIAATIRAGRLSSLAERAEKFSRDHELEEAADLYPELSMELERVLKEIDEVITA